MTTRQTKPAVRQYRETNAEKKQRSNGQEKHGGKDPERSKQAKQAMMRKPPLHHLLFFKCEIAQQTTNKASATSEPA